jgi:hypothetical protein
MVISIEAIGNDRLERNADGLGLLDQRYRDLRLGLERWVLLAIGQAAFRRIRHHM